jgi:hypothetical protein
MLGVVRSMGPIFETSQKIDRAFKRLADLISSWRIINIGSQPYGCEPNGVVLNTIAIFAQKMPGTKPQ